MRTFLITITSLTCISFSLAEDKPNPIIPDEAKLETLWEEGEFTEGVAKGPDGKIYFSDISRDEKPGKVYRFDPKNTKVDVYCPDSGKSNGLMFNADGELIACCGANYGRMSLAKILPDGSVQDLVTSYQGKRLNSPNDLVINSKGWVYFSDPRYVGPEPVELDHMSVYLFKPEDKSLTRVTTMITKPNGVMLSPDAKTLYVAETNNGTTNIDEADQANLKKKMTLNAFPVREDGSLGKRRILIDFGDKLGTDGMTVDSQGHIYAAVRSADRYGIRVYTPDGKEIASIPTPDLPTNCCFSEKTLYITAGVGLYRIDLKTGE